MDSNEVKNLMEAYASIYAPKEEVEQIDEISADLALKASKAADIKRGKLSVAGDTEGAAKKASQASRLYAKQAKIRLNREEVDVFETVLEFLCVEGYAETLEEAEWMMANVIDDEAIGIILGEALTGERYKKVMKKPGGTTYSRKVSADPAKRATRGGRGGESDFGAGDRGSGNKAARRAGTYQEEYMDEAQEARNNPEKYEAGEKKKYAPVRGERTPMPPRGNKKREDFEKWYAANVR